MVGPGVSHRLREGGGSVSDLQRRQAAVEAVKGQCYTLKCFVSIIVAMVPEEPAYSF